MLELGRTRNSTLPARLARTANQSLAKQNRKSSQLIENNHQHPKSIASFCRVFRDYGRLGMTFWHERVALDAIQLATSFKKNLRHHPFVFVI
jgi:hypothetical protein